MQLDFPMLINQHSTMQYYAKNTITTIILLFLYSLIKKVKICYMIFTQSNFHEQRGNLFAKAT